MAMLPGLPSSTVEAERAAPVQAALLAWYAAHKRDLPWRHSRDPYAILVAEVMLQQTQVDRVIPRWRAWLELFPTLADLARASRGDAIRAWHGLGYNLRAIRLHALAAEVVAQHDGALPRDLAGLQALKGIGRYTAGAIACFAYEQPVTMVDTNIRRVLSRVFHTEPQEVDALAERILPAHAAYAWQQALMDLGATLCRARQPMCLLCPLVATCGGIGPGVSVARQKKQGEFRGSARFFRGRLIDALRSRPMGASVDELAALPSMPSDRGRILELLRGLAGDGLLTIDLTDWVRLAD